MIDQKSRKNSPIIETAPETLRGPMNSRPSCIALIVQHVLCISLVVVSMLMLTGCGTGEASDARQDTVYVCTETGELSLGPSRETPAVNEETGNRTLLRGLYCEKCDKWYPAPPSRSFGGNPLQMPCPKTGGPLSATGNLEADVTLDNENLGNRTEVGRR